MATKLPGNLGGALPQRRSMSWAWLVLLVCTSCQTAHETKPPFKFPILMDLPLSSPDAQEAQWQRRSHYRTRYVGPLRDTVSRMEGMAILKFTAEFGSGSCMHPDSGMLDIHVDTSTRVTHYESATAGAAYPAWIVNRSATCLDLGLHNLLPLVLEARDTAGMWRAIEYSFLFCATGERSLHLPPGNAVLVATPIFKGEFPTLLRLRYEEGDVSAPFAGSIHRSQFKAER